MVWGRGDGMVEAIGEMVNLLGEGGSKAADRTRAGLTCRLRR